HCMCRITTRSRDTRRLNRHEYIGRCSCTGRVPGERSEPRQARAEASAADRVFCCRNLAKTLADASRLVPIAEAVRTERITCSARPPNGSDAHLQDATTCRRGRGAPLAATKEKFCG